MRRASAAWSIARCERGTGCGPVRGSWRRASGPCRPPSRRSRLQAGRNAARTGCKIDMVSPLRVRCRQRELHAADRRQPPASPVALQGLPLELPGIDIAGERNRLKTRFFRRQVVNAQRRQLHVVVKTQAKQSGRVELRIAAVAEQAVVEINLDNVLAQDVTQRDPALAQGRLAAASCSTRRRVNSGQVSRSRGRFLTL